VAGGLQGECSCNRRRTAVARYKTIDTSPRFLAVDLEAQLLPGTFEHALNHLLDHEIDLSGLDACPPLVRPRDPETVAETPPLYCAGGPRMPGACPRPRAVPPALPAELPRDPRGMAQRTVARINRLPRDGLLTHGCYAAAAAGRRLIALNLSGC
jgi:hypothetical protein